LALGLLLQNAAFAQTFPPGKYLMEGGAGSLRIEAPKNGTQAFSISTLDMSNAYCDLSGTIGGAKGQVQSEGKPSACVVDLRAGRDGVHADTATPEACAEFCGARTSFVGDYLRLPAACTGETYAAALKQYKDHLDRAEYAPAGAILEPLYASCHRFLSTAADAEQRNDLALTRFQQGNARDCLRIIAPLVKWAKMSDQEIDEAVRPNDPTYFMEIAARTRETLALCGQKTAAKNKRSARP
jgi:hypothetical protein